VDEIAKYSKPLLVDLNMRIYEVLLYISVLLQGTRLDNIRIYEVLFYISVLLQGTRLDNNNQHQ